MTSQQQHATAAQPADDAAVTGMCSTAELDLVQSLDADHVIDYTRDDFANGTDRYDLILDNAGNPAPSRLHRALTPRETAVIVGGEEGGKWTGSIGRQYRALALSPFTRQRLTFVVSNEAGDLDTLAGLLETGKVTPSIDMTLPLAHAPEALRYFDAEKSTRKNRHHHVGPQAVIEPAHATPNPPL